MTVSFGARRSRTINVAPQPGEYSTTRGGLREKVYNGVKVVPVWWLNFKLGRNYESRVIHHRMTSITVRAHCYFIILRGGCSARSM